MNKCELCNSLAKMYCESDQASLCWDCDAKVHAANFLVAKHSRTLLCHLCQSLTPWTASGPKLTPTVSLCSSCANRSSCREERRNEADHSRHDDDDDDDDLDREDDGAHRDDSEDSDNGSGGGDEDDEENQVVPWSSTAPPPPASSSSNSDDHESSSGVVCASNEPGVFRSRSAFSSKRSRDSAQDDVCYPKKFKRSIFL